MSRKKRRKTRAKGNVDFHGQVWRVTYTVRGQRVRRNTGIHDPGEEGEKAAQKFLAEELAKAELQRGPVIPGRVTFDQLVQLLRDNYVDKRRRAPERMEYSVARLREFFGRDKASDITSDRIDAYKRSRRDKGVSDGTIRLELAALKRAFRLAVKRALLQMDEVPSFPELESGKPRKGFFERADFERVLTHLPEHLRDIATFAYLTGVRKSEALGLQWKDVNTDARVITLLETKNGDDRPLYYAQLPELAAVMQGRDVARKALLRERGMLCPWVFWHAGGKPIRDFSHAWREACKAANVPGRLFHDLRRTAIRNLVRQGVPDKVAMLISGHETRSVFDNYNITGGADVAGALGRLAGSVSVPLSPISAPNADSKAAGGSGETR